MVLGTYVLKDGRIEPAGGLDRGGPIVWSGEEWRSRYRAVRRRDQRDVVLFIVATLSISDVVLWFLARPSDLWFWFLASWVVPPLLLLMLAIIIVEAVGYAADRIPRGAPCSGLYEHGVQVNRALFLPYHELGEVVVENGFVRLVPRHSPEKGGWLVPNPQQWTVVQTLLGEEGLRELRARVAGGEKGEEPPALRVYGPVGIV